MTLKTNFQTETFTSQLSVLLIPIIRLYQYFSFYFREKMGQDQFNVWTIPKTVKLHQHSPFEAAQCWGKNPSFIPLDKGSVAAFRKEGPAHT